MPPTLTTLVSFNNSTALGSIGNQPFGRLIVDANGDFFSTTSVGGAGSDGTVFELVNNGGGSYTPTALFTFNGSNGNGPPAGLIADANGDLFGTTSSGGANDDGTVFALVNNGGGSFTPVNLASFSGTSGKRPAAGLIADAQGDLFGTTNFGGTDFFGTVFEIVNNRGTFAATPTTLVSFNDTNGSEPVAGLIADAQGNLFGTTSSGGANGVGTVFEIVKTNGSFATTPTTLVSFNGTNGATPDAGLIADAQGDLFGTTGTGGANKAGTVFEIVKTNGSFATTPITLVSFNGTNGATPQGDLIADARGDLFGTTNSGGANFSGTVFEIVKTNGSFATTPTTLVSFNGTNGARPDAGLIADAQGNLFGTTFVGGANGVGTVFEITGAGFQVAPPPPPPPPPPPSAPNPPPPAAPNPPPPAGTTADMILRQAVGNYEIYDIGNNSILFAGPLGQVGPDFQFAGLGNFGGSDTTDMMLRSVTSGNFEVYDISNNNITGAAALGAVGSNFKVAGFGNFNGAGTTTDMMLRDSNTGTFELYNIGNNVISGASNLGAVGLDFQVQGFGDFNGDGTTDMLLRNTSTGAFEDYDIKNGKIAGAHAMGAVGNDFQLVGFGDFNGDGTSDMMLRNTTSGAFELYTVNHDAITSASPIGAVGLDFQVAGFGPFNGAGSADMVLRKVNSGAFEVYDIKNGQLTGAAPLGSVGLDFVVGGFAPIILPHG